MVFSDDVKNKVKHMAAFRCCRCQKVGVEIHHIVPLKEGGPDDIENAAPLCPSCHSEVGDNPAKRREIIDMRDWWYVTCVRKYGPDDVETAAKLDALMQDMEWQRNKLDDLRNVLREMANRVIDKMTPGTATITASRIAGMATDSGTTYFQRVDIGPHEAVLVCRGEIDMHTSGVFGAVLSAAVAEPDTKRIVVDLTDSSYIDSTGMGFLFHAQGVLKGRDGSLEMVGISPIVERIITTLGMDKIITIHASRADAGIDPDQPVEVAG